MQNEESAEKRKRSATKYWVEINGTTYARFQYKTEAGIRKVKYKPITDKRRARSVVEKMRNDLDTHGEETFHSEKMTFDELVDKFEEKELIEASYQNGVKVKGRRSIGPVQSAIKPLRSFFGKKAIRLINPADIKSYKDVRLATPIETEFNEKQRIVDEKTGKKKTMVRKAHRIRERKVASVNRELTVFRTILNFAVNNDWLVRNPFTRAKGVISTAAEVERDRVLSFDEEQRLLNVCTGRREHLKSLLICSLDTAMRRGEIFKMQWKEVDLLTNEISVPQSNTKTEEARTVGITPRLREELERLWDISSKDPNSRVFGITTTVKTAFQAACIESGLENFRFHDCRHTATTRMIASGSPHTEVMKITGHSQMKTFLRYLNITKETTSSVTTRLHNYLADRQIPSELVSEKIN